MYNVNETHAINDCIPVAIVLNIVLTLASLSEPVLVAVHNGTSTEVGQPEVGSTKHLK